MTINFYEVKKVEKEKSNIQYPIIQTHSVPIKNIDKMGSWYLDPENFTWIKMKNIDADIIIIEPATDIFYELMIRQ